MNERRGKDKVREVQQHLSKSVKAGRLYYL